MPALLRVSVILLILSALVSPCQAGKQLGSQAHREDSRFSAEALAAFSKKVERHAAKQGARAFFLARLGMPENELPKGITFTHIGLAVYSEISAQNASNAPGEETDQPQKKLYGYAIHNLYQDATTLNRSNLVQDYPMDFFAGVEKLKAGIVIPTPKLQQKLIAALEQGRFQSMHNANYSVIANPYTLKYQNCTEHMLDFLFAAIYDTADMAQIKANQRAWFKAQRLDLSPFKQLLAATFTRDIYTLDHPDQLETATFDTIAHFLVSNGLAQPVEVIE